MDPVLAALLPLAALDNQRRALDEQLKQAERKLARAGEATAAAAATVATLQAELDATRKALAKLDAELKQFEKRRDQAIRALEQGMGSADAAQRQQETCEARIDELETESLEAMDTRERLDGELAAARKAHADAQAAEAAQHDKLDPTMRAARAELQRVLSERPPFIEALPRKERTTYEQLTERKGYALAAIEEEACAACRKVVPYQMRADLKSGRTISCANCYRWLYLPAMLEPSTETA